MKHALIAILAICQFTSFAQQYSLGEQEFTQQKEEATTFTVFDKSFYPILADSIDLSGQLPPAGNQGAKGSCWAWATTYILRSIMDNHTTFLVGNNTDNAKVYSPEYVYQYYKGPIKDCNWGAISSEMLAKILKDGAVKLEDFSYNEYACDNQPNQSLRNKAKANAKPEYSVDILKDLASIKKVLAVEHQPLVLSIKVDDYFCKIGNITALNPFWRNYGTRAGSHAMVVAGYNDRLQALKVLNSWGPNFGNHGYVWISYSIINAAMNYCCYPKKTLESLPVTKKSSQKESDATAFANSTTSSSWFKEGYYRPFNNLKIVLAKLSSSNHYAVIEVRNNDYELLTNFYIDLKSSKEFPALGKKYRFTFDNIDKAGKNPFNKAVYFTISSI
jgi:hypothetical protein